MFSGLDDLLKDGGMSAPAWAFFSGICLALIALLREAVQARHAVIEAKHAVTEAKDKVEQTQGQIDEVKQLAEPTGNGFAAKVLKGQEEILQRLRRLETGQDVQQETLMKHLLEHDHKAPPGH